MTAAHGGSPVLKALHHIYTASDPARQRTTGHHGSAEEMRGVVRCHTARMPSEDPLAPPENPKTGQNWVDEAGDLYTWDGDGMEWVPFEDIPFFKPSQSFKDL